MDFAGKTVVNVVRRFAFEEWGGTETVVWNISQELRRLGLVPEIVATRALSATADEFRDGIAIRRFNYFYPRFPLSADSVMRLDKKGGDPFSHGLLSHLSSRSGAALFHCHSMARMAGMTRHAAKHLGVPYVLSFHGGHYEVPPEELREMMRPIRGSLNYGKALDWMLHSGRALEDCGGIVCVGYNEHLRTREQFPDKPVAYIPNGTHPELFAVEPSGRFRAELRINADAFLILCVSRIDYQKNQKMLVDLTARLTTSGDNVHLALIGPVTAPDYHAELTALATKLGLQDKVTVITGLAPGSPELVDAYLSSDLFVLPSIHEPFGIVALEAWAARLPVLAANVGGLQHLVENGRTGLFFDPYDLGQLEALTRSAMADRGLGRALADNAHRKVVEQYSWDKIAAQQLDFYAEVLERHHGHNP